MQSSKGMCKFIRIIELNFIIEGRVNDSIMKMYLKSGCMPVLWRKSFMKIASDRDTQFIGPKRSVRPFVISVEFRWR